MSYLYWDASALIKRYAPETGTDFVNLCFSNVSLNRMMCLALSTGEVISAFVRKRNDGTITHEDFSQALLGFRFEVLDGDEFRFASVSDTLVLESHSLIEQHNLNATDAAILCSALDIAEELRQEDDRVILVTTDHRLLRAAESEGLPVLNPEDASEEDLASLADEEE